MAAEVQGFQYRCPECGTLNEDSAITFPNCAQCRENLLKCSYCARFPGVGKVCPFFPRQPLTRNDVVPDCGERQSTLLIGLRPFLLRPLGTRHTPSILTFTVLGLIVAAASMFGPESSPRRPRGLEIAPRLVEKPVLVGGTVVVRLEIANRDPEHAAGFRVRMSQHDPVFRCVSTDPVAVTEVASSRRRYFLFKPLRPGDSISLQLKFQAMQAGREQRLFFEVLPEGDHLENPPLEALFHINVLPAPPILEREAARPSGTQRPPLRNSDRPVS